MFWIPAFAGMTMLTAFDDCDTVTSGGHLWLRFALYCPFVLGLSKQPLPLAFSL
jgi:hypothetical protein